MMISNWLKSPLFISSVSFFGCGDPLASDHSSAKSKQSGKIEYFSDNDLIFDQPSVQATVTNAIWNVSVSSKNLIVNLFFDDNLTPQKGYAYKFEALSPFDQAEGSNVQSVYVQNVETSKMIWPLNGDIKLTVVPSSGKDSFSADLTVRVGVKRISANISGPFMNLDTNPVSQWILGGSN